MSLHADDIDSGPAPVGYFWQDDSTRNEAERVQLFARVHETPADLPLRWFLNEGAILPNDLGRLRATVEHFGFVLVVLDSVYNFTPGLDLKDRDVGQLFARIKAEICDPTGCTVVVVDHMPWATDNNRKRLRSYGDVFKGAAARAGIYIDAEGSKLWVEARGNNITGFKRTPAFWDPNALELCLIDAKQVDREERKQKLAEWVEEHPGAMSKALVGVGGLHELSRELVYELQTDGAITIVRPRPRDDGKDPHYLYPASHAETPHVPLFDPNADDDPSGTSQSTTVVPRPAPIRGTTVDGTNNRRHLCPVTTATSSSSSPPSTPATSPSRSGARRSVLTVCWRGPRRERREAKARSRSRESEGLGPKAHGLPLLASLGHGDDRRA